MAFEFPQQALDWLLGGCGSSVLVMADALVMPRLLASCGYDVCVVSQDALRLRVSLGTADISLVTARAEALPFDDCRFDAAYIHQVFPDIAPGLAMPEIARVLRPQGRLAISHLGRDNTVPWVRRLAQLMHGLDETAMSAPGVDEVLAPASQSKYFPEPQRRDFRHWEAVTHDELVAMVGATPAVRELDDASRQRFLDAAGQIYDQAAGHNQLRLPYVLGCWRGQVDQDELTRPVRLDEPGVAIYL